MKRAKMLLAAIAVFAVVGGAYAFKAREFHSIFVPTVANGACTFEITGRTTLPTTGATVLRSATIVASTTCPLTTVYISD